MSFPFISSSLLNTFTFAFSESQSFGKPPKVFALYKFSSTFSSISNQG